MRVQDSSLLTAVADGATRDQFIIPKNENLKQHWDRTKQPCTTLMIHSIPRAYTRSALIGDIEEIIGQNTFDFVYLPWNVEKQENMGCAFVDFRSADIARRAAKKFKMHLFPSQSRPAKVSPAHVQGLKANIQYYIGKGVSSKSNPFGPLVFIDGEALDIHRAAFLFCLASKIDDKPDDQSQPPSRSVPIANSRSSPPVPTKEAKGYRTHSLLKFPKDAEHVLMDAGYPPGLDPNAEPFPLFSEEVNTCKRSTSDSSEAAFHDEVYDEFDYSTSKHWGQIFVDFYDEFPEGKLSRATTTSTNNSTSSGYNSTKAMDSTSASSSSSKVSSDQSGGEVDTLLLSRFFDKFGGP